MTENKRFTLGKDYDSDGNWEYCYQDEETGRIFNFADEFCHIDFLELVNAVINNLEKENKELKTFKDKVFEVIDNHILEETDLRKECIENGSHYNANISRNIIDTLKLIKKELSE